MVGQVVKREAFVRAIGATGGTALDDPMVVDPKAWMQGPFLLGSASNESTAGGVFESEYLIDMRQFSNIAR
jgi:hypothetical protein